MTAALEDWSLPSCGCGGFTQSVLQPFIRILLAKCSLFSYSHNSFFFFFTFLQHSKESLQWLYIKRTPFGLCARSEASRLGHKVKVNCEVPKGPCATKVRDKASATCMFISFQGCFVFLSPTKLKSVACQEGKDLAALDAYLKRRLFPEDLEVIGMWLCQQNAAIKPYWTTPHLFFPLLSLGINSWRDTLASLNSMRKRRCGNWAVLIWVTDKLAS